MCDYGNRGKRNELLVGYMYGELEGAERDEFEAHMAGCAACRLEAGGLRATREHLAAWAPPEAPAGEGLRLVPGAGVPVAAPRHRSLWTWGLGAAAALVLAASAAVANLEVRVGQEGLVVRTGWAAPSAVAQSGGTDLMVRETSAGTDLPEQWLVTLAHMQARLDELEKEAAARSAAPEGTLMAAAPSRTSDADLLRRVRDIVAQSEARQQREYTILLSQVARDWDRQRRSDLAAISQGLSQVQGFTNTEIAQQREVMNQFIRVSTPRQEK